MFSRKQENTKSILAYDSNNINYINNPSKSFIGDSQIKEKKPIQEKTNEIINIDECFEILFKKSKHFKLSKIQNAMYEDKNVREHKKELINGEDAIAFFAKYGNTTPIKFIHCKNAVREDFNPYKLTIIHDENELAKLKEYYTVSPSGIVHIYSKGVVNRTENFINKTPTEFVSLSDWMRESTMFNILSNIDFFKNYLANKIFKSWRQNVKKIIYNKTREKLRHSVFFCKPAYISSIFEIKNTLSNINNFELVNFSQFQQKQVDFEEFKSIQKDVRNKVSKEYDQIFEEVNIQLLKVVTFIEDSKYKANEQEIESKMSLKQKPLNMIKKEKDEKILRKKLYNEDFKMLGTYIRMINYMTTEILIENNNRSLIKIEEEIFKERKNGLFTTSPQMEELAINFLHKEDDILSAIDSIIFENIILVKGISKLIKSPSYEKYIKDMISKLQTSENQITPEIDDIINKSQIFLICKERIKYKIETDFIECRKKIDINYSQCKRIEQDRQKFKAEEWIAENPSLEEVKNKLLVLKDYRKEITEKIKDYFYGIVHVDSKILRNILSTFINDSLSKIKEYLYGLTLEKLNKTLKKGESLLSNFNPNFDTLVEYCDFIKKVKDVKEATESLDTNKEIIENMFKLLKQVNHVFVMDDKSKYEEISRIRDKILEEIPINEEAIKSKKEVYKLKFEEEIQLLEIKVSELYQLLNHQELRKNSTPFLEAINKIKFASDLLEKLNGKISKCKQYSSLMELPFDDIKFDTKVLTDLLEYKRTIWEGQDKFNKKYDEWLEGNIKKLSIESIEQEVLENDILLKNAKDKMKEIIPLIRSFNNIFGFMPVRKGTNESNSDELENDEALMVFSRKLDNMKDQIPMIGCLSNKNLKDKHWLRILELIEGGSSLLGKLSISFQELVSLGVKNYQNNIEEISSRASGEAAIEQDIDKIKLEWSDLCFSISPYRDSKDKFVLNEVSDIFEKINDDLIKLQSMMSSKYSSDIKESLIKWEKKIVIVGQTIEEWIVFQKSWMYLENVFLTDDIQQQLPAEYSKFHTMNKFWKELMNKAYKKSNVLDNINSPDLLAKLIESNEQMEVIQKMLDDYLELKRKLFPRFYFLSNEDLLEIFSQTRHPEAIQPHLRKCFDNIKLVKFSESDPLINKDDNHSKSIIAIVSAEPEECPETISLSNSVETIGSIEVWLRSLERSMRESLYISIRDSLKDHCETIDVLDLDKALEYPAQVAIALNMIRWTNITENLLKIGSVDMMLISVNKLISSLVDKTKDELTFGKRELIKNLIVSNVHNRDIIELLIRGESKITDFNWIKQLRYYWSEVDEDLYKPTFLSYKSANSFKSDDNIDSNRKKSENCLIKQTDAVILYGYEYLGNSPRLVITPLTDKCYITLTSALNLTYGGAPAGPAGTGKTETTKDLAKAIAIVCIVFNCSDSLDFKTMGRFFSGLAQCGAWACFDEFNRINVEVLSVIAQQILMIQGALRANKSDFDFEGKIINLNSSFGVFITMNPGYAGRSELPDNLKSLFRPVAMMIPDYSLIAEIMLFSEGFQKAKILSQKMVHLFKLSSEQLSKQKHYDFGMRAVKTVLSMAGFLRRKFVQLDEDQILLRAMKDSNVPKFLKHDLKLFEGIIKDLFPNTNMQTQVDEKMIEKSKEFLDSQSFQCTDIILNKIREVHEVSSVRHGVMLVGRAFTGKSTIIDCVVYSSEHISKPINLYKLNPKSLTSDELFGYMDVLTSNFTHGIVWKLIISSMETEPDSQKWLLFDGPVDADWIENLNTVLDDNRMLCLPDGKRIKLPNNYSMIFEVENLNAASPATVSRVGMIYFDQETLSPLSEFYKYEQTLKSEFKNRYKNDDIINIINKIIVSDDFFSDMRNFTISVLEFHYSKGRQPMNNVANSLVRNSISLFEIEFDKFISGLMRRVQEIKPPNSLEKFLRSLDIKSYILSLYAISLTWAFAGGYSLNERVLFNNEFKTEFENKVGPLFNEGSTLFDVFFNSNKLSYCHWNEMIEAYTLKENTNYGDILIETPESVIAKYLINILCQSKKSILISGNTGVGKTAIVKNFLKSLGNDYESLVCPFSAQTLAKNVTGTLQEKLFLRGKDLVPHGGKDLVFFIDDINMPKYDKYGSQSAIEIIRQLIDQGGFYDMKKYVFRHVKNTVFISACVPPENGRNVISQRLTRHFYTMNLTDLAPSSLELIFTSITKEIYNANPDKTFLLGKIKPIVLSAIKIYNETSAYLLPTPSKCHYTFNLRDLSKLFQGMTLQKCNISNEECFYNLFAHEVMRVFYDRLTETNDQNWLVSCLLKELPQVYNFNQKRIESIIFSSLLSKDYSQVQSETDLGLFLNDSLKDYSIISGQKLSIVLFSEAIRQVCRITRVLSFPRGHSLLLGISGGGKNTLSSLAVYLNKNNLFKIELTKNYKFQSWRDDLVKMFKLSISLPTLDGRKGVCFFISENQLIQNSFLEDINSLLNTGEVPNLIGKDNVDDILETFRNTVKSQKEIQSLSKSEMINLAFSMFKENFHLILSFSPSGSNFREKCRQFPSLINCCSISYFSKWPEEALSLVSEHYLNIAFPTFTDWTLKNISSIFSKIITTIENVSLDFYKQTKRKFYITPSSCISTLKTFIKMFQRAQGIIPVKIKIYETGLAKLNETKNDISLLKEKLIEFQPQLEEAKILNKNLLADLEVKNQIAVEKEMICSREATEIEKTQKEVSEMRRVCQAELDEAIPALIAAQHAAKNIDKSYISTIKAYNNVAKDIDMVLCAVNLLFGKKETWEEVKRFLGDMDFIKKLQNLDPMTVKPAVWQKLRNNYLSRPEFNPVILKEKISEAVSTLANYCINVETYYLKKRDVEPKEKALEAAELKLSSVEEEMNKKFSELNEIKLKVAELNSQLEESISKETYLENEQKRTILHLERAEKLLVGLSEEFKRWEGQIKILSIDKDNLYGNMILCSAIVNLLGPLNMEFRKITIDLMKEITESKNITSNEELVLEDLLSDPVTVRDWQSKGLSADSFSTENAIIIDNSDKSPLLIDPQAQMTKWLKSGGGSSEMTIVKYSNPQLLKLVENAIRFGNSILVEGVEEKLDPALDNALIKSVYKKGSQFFIKFNDNEIPYNSSFKIILSTKLQNPLYLPEITIKVNLINCCVTEQGLQDQILVQIVLNESPKLEEQRDLLIRQISEDKKLIADIQARILRLINDVQGNLLEDEELIKVLDESKDTSESINLRMTESENTNRQISITRDIYKPLSELVSLLYFILTSLFNINNMYLFSLESFILFFNLKLKENKELKDSPCDRVVALKDFICYNIFENISKGLYEQHKLLFSFMIASKILILNNKSYSKSWNILLNGIPSDYKADISLIPDYIPENARLGINYMLTKNTDMFSLMETLVSSKEKYVGILNKKEIQMSDLDDIEEFSEVTVFNKLIFLKFLRPDKLNQLVFSFVKNTIGERYVDFPSVNLKSTILRSISATPILFILSSGADPLSKIKLLSQEFDMELKFRIVSLGQGQGHRAKELIKTSAMSGEWVLLQNCHLASSWLMELEQLIEIIQDDLHKDFRLFLTTMPCSYFPQSILSNSIKITIEPPKGVRANLRQIYNSISPSNYDETTKPNIYKPLLFCLSLYHTILLERRQYGSIGWNIAYEWMISDFETSEKHLKNYVERESAVPFETLTFLIGIINYGGRITDYNDEKTCSAILRQLFNASKLKTGVSFDKNSDSVYRLPNTDNLSHILDYIGNLPFVDLPEILGLNSNASIKLEKSISSQLIQNIQSMDGSGISIKSNKDSETQVMSIVDYYLNLLPVYTVISKKDIEDEVNPLLIFRNQENDRFIILLKRMRESLLLLKDALKGFIVMSAELDEALVSIMSQNVPTLWSRVGYLSLKPLSSWFKDLIQRVEFFNIWIKEGKMNSYWISAFFFPQGFFTSVLQEYSRSKNTAIDSLIFETRISQETYVDNSSVEQIPSIGVNIHGFFLENASWSKEEQVLLDSIPNILIETLPIIHFKPIIKSNMHNGLNEYYQAPVYKTLERKGELSTTGHSTNFITYINMPIDDEDSDQWTVKGAAIILQTDE